MTPEQIDRVFGRGRLKMATGEHVEVFREAVPPGERRRYTKRFLKTIGGDYGQWTEREWRILARLIGHGVRSVPEVVQFDRGVLGGSQHVQTYDAGATVDQWATILPVSRQGKTHRHIFEDCAHWWALAHHSLLALQEIHELHVIHLDIKGDNVCIPVGPAEFDPVAPGLLLYPRFDQLAMIDFAFALVSRERLTTALPLGWETDYDYQSPRLLNALEAGRRGDLQPTRELDWRCDMYSLAAMLKRYLPEEEVVHEPRRATGWSVERYDAAKRLILGLRDVHDRDAPEHHPHQELIKLTRERMLTAELTASLQHGWTLARDATLAPVAASPLTPVTRLAPPTRIMMSPRVTVPAETSARIRQPLPRTSHAPRVIAASALVALIGAGIAVALAPTVNDSLPVLANGGRVAFDAARGALDRLLGSGAPSQESQASQLAEGTAASPAGSGQELNGDSQAKGETLPVKDTNPPSANAAEESASGKPTPANEATPAKQEAAASAPASQRDPTSEPPSAAASVPAEAVPPVRAAVAASQGSTQARAGRSAAPTARTAATIGAKRSAAARGSRDVAASSPATASSASRAIPQARMQLASPPTHTSPPRGSATAGTAQTAPAAANREAVEPSTAQVEVTPEESRIDTKANSIERRRTPAAAESLQREEPARPAPEHGAQIAPPAQPSRRVEAKPAPPTGLAGVLTSLFTLARGDGRMAPLEERTPHAVPLQNAAPRPPARLAQSDVSPAPTNPGRPELASVAVPDVEQPVPLNPATRSPTWERSSSVATVPSALTPLSSDTPDASQEDFAALAKRMLAQSVPRTAMQAEVEVSRVLGVAAKSQRPGQERDIVDAVHRRWPSDVVSMTAVNPAPAMARSLNDQARQAFLSRRSAREAFDLQLRAFGADPRDPEVAGNLAFLYLKLNPPQPEIARQVAMHAIALNSVQLHTTRADDWLTFAVANALIGRDEDATNALYVTVALTADLERSCRAALGAAAGYGERLRAPVQAMMMRIHSQGREYESSACSWPPRWSTARAYF